MRVLLVHNYYGSAAPSGENEVFEVERSLLERQGLEVKVFVRRSDEIRRLRVLGLLHGALVTPWNPWMARKLRHIVTEYRPDVVHVHNTFPLISPAIFPAIGDGAARVLTLHNYRLFCASAICARRGEICTQCLDRRSALPAVRYGCYRNSRLATLPLAAGIALHRRLRVWEEQVDAFVALSGFQRRLMVRAGLPADRVWVKPNFYPGRPAVVPWSERRDCAVFAGRITEEKGVANLVAAWDSWGGSAPELRIFGDGPLRRPLEMRAREGGVDRVNFVGHVAPSVAQAEIANARLVVVPSVWFEGFPMVLREAFAFGTPAAVSDIGPLPEIVEHGRTGVVFRANDSMSLLQTVRRAWEDGGQLEGMSRRARQEYENKYAEPTNYQMLQDIYGHAKAVQEGRARAARSTPGQ